MGRELGSPYIWMEHCKVWCNADAWKIPTRIYHTTRGRIQTTYYQTNVFETHCRLSFQTRQEEKHETAWLCVGHEKRFDFSLTKLQRRISQCVKVFQRTDQSIRPLRFMFSFALCISSLVSKAICFIFAIYACDVTDWLILLLHQRILTTLCLTCLIYYFMMSRLKSLA